MAYTNDVKAIFDADCIRCHNASKHDAGVDLSTYTQVIKTLTPGSASSKLVRVTTSGGSMYNEFSGSRATKAATVRSWVVDNQAAQSR